ncbi:hypothetical protein AGDE_00034 [Angomonas deanei]|nr:hypothetical protein AGDE_00034 [Angomonas deanei]|eukprot:EPY43886.1 hypothetical protein AGDE_00034 [Angomonas deanei]
MVAGEPLGFLGSGFHMRLNLEVPVDSNDTGVITSLDPSFFFDIEEVQSQSQVFVNGEDRTSEFLVIADSVMPFDIEAPVFNINYSENQVVIMIAKKSSSEFKGTGQLRLPIHARYEHLDAKAEFSLWKLVNGESSYVNRCVGPFQVKRGDEYYGETPKYCIDIPTGVLQDLPFVYRSLVSLLIAGSVVVVLAI